MYQVAAYVHLLAAITWLGGMIFLGIVLIPVTRRSQGPPGHASRILGAAARRFRIVAWVALATLAGTGIWMALQRAEDPTDIITASGRFFQALRIKLALVALVLSLSAIHDFVLGPRLARRLEAVAESSSRNQAISRRRTLVSWLARINLVLALVILALGIVLVRGLPFQVSGDD